MYTDGSECPRTRKCSWAYLIVNNNNVYGKARKSKGAINRMELLAVIMALYNLRRTTNHLEIYTDSLFVIDFLKILNPKYKKARILRKLLQNRTIEIFQVLRGSRPPEHSVAHNMARRAIGL